MEGRNFDWHFDPPTPTAGEIAEKGRMDDEEIETRFWEGLEQHTIGIDGRPNYIYTERKPNDNQTYVVFSNVGKRDSDAKIFSLARPASTENTKKPQNSFRELDEEEMRYLNEIQKEIVSNIDSKGNPNKINISEMGRHVTIAGEKYFFFYIPKGSGAGIDAFRDTKRVVGMRNR